MFLRHELFSVPESAFPGLACISLTIQSRTLYHASELDNLRVLCFSQSVRFKNCYITPGDSVLFVSPKSVASPVANPESTLPPAPVKSFQGIMLNVEFT